MYNWNQSLDTGKQGVSQVMRLLQERPDTLAVVDVQNDPAFQPRDIDLIWQQRGPNGAATTISIEVKWDRFTTGNFAFETRSVVEHGTLGCFLSSEADIWYYGFPNLSRIYVLPLEMTRKWFSTTGRRYRRNVTSSAKTGGKWHTEFAVVPIADVLTGVPGIEIITL